MQAADTRDSCAPANMEEIGICINRRCSVCGRNIRVTVYKDGRYRGGEYFGQMPELAMRKRSREHEDRALASEIWLHSDEYWECLECALQ
jgi:hypothetical protein